MDSFNITAKEVERQTDEWHDHEYKRAYSDWNRAWKRWCDDDGRTTVSTKQRFGRDLAAAAPGVVRRRGGGNVAFYEGIKLKGNTS